MAAGVAPRKPARMVVVAVVVVQEMVSIPVARRPQDRVMMEGILLEMLVAGAAALVPLVKMLPCGNMVAMAAMARLHP